MAIVQIRGFCATCDHQKLFTKAGPSHIFHLIVSVVTVGLWLPIWIICVIANAFAPFRCADCGQWKIR